MEDADALLLGAGVGGDRATVGDAGGLEDVAVIVDGEDELVGDPRVGGVTLVAVAEGLAVVAGECGDVIEEVARGSDVIEVLGGELDAAGGAPSEGVVLAVAPLGVEGQAGQLNSRAKRRALSSADSAGRPNDRMCQSSGTHPDVSVHRERQDGLRNFRKRREDCHESCPFCISVFCVSHQAYEIRNNDKLRSFRVSTSAQLANSCLRARKCRSILSSDRFRGGRNHEMIGS